MLSISLRSSSSIPNRPFCIFCVLSASDKLLVSGGSDCHGRSRHRKIERGALPRLGLKPDPAASPLDDLLTSRQPDAGAFKLLPVQSLEDAKYLVLVLRRDTDTVVAHREDRFS